MILKNVIYELILIIMIFFFVKEIKIKSNDDINFQKKINITKITNKILINSGFFVLNRKLIFKGKLGNYGGDGKLLLTDDDSFVLTTVKVLKQGTEEVPIFLRSYKVGLYGIKNDGKIKWGKTFGFNNMDSNVCIKALGLKNNGYIFLIDIIESSVYEKKHYIGVLKINNDGDIEWNKIFGNKNNVKESIEGRKILKLDDGYIIIGDIRQWGDEIRKNIYVLYVDKNGNKLWDNEIIIGDKDYISIIDGYISNNYLVLLADINRKNNFIIIELNLKSNKIEQKLFFNIDEIIGRSFLYRSNILKIENGNIIIGEIRINRVSNLFVLYKKSNISDIKFDIFSNKNYEISYKGFLKDKDGNFIVYGNIRYKIRDYVQEIFLMKFDKDGKNIYTQIFKMGDSYSGVRDMKINEGGELIGLFRWCKKIGDKYIDYISIEKIEVK